MPDYPLIDNPDGLRAASGRPLADVTVEAAAAGALEIADVQVSAETLRAQAEVARAAGYANLAANLARAAELTAVPNDELLRMYETLRPGRVSHAELIALAERLEGHYQAPENARLVREAGVEPAACIERAWTVALARKPSETEKSEALALLDILATDAKAADATVGAGPTPPRALENPPGELAKLPPERAAALAKLCLAVFNLNEFIFID